MSKEAPTYHTGESDDRSLAESASLADSLLRLGYIVSVVVASIATVCCIVLKIGYDRANKQRDAVSKEAIEEQWSQKDMSVVIESLPSERFRAELLLSKKPAALLPVIGRHTSDTGPDHRKVRRKVSVLAFRKRLFLSPVPPRAH